MKEIAQKEITLCGAFGFGNAGDEAVYLAVEDLAEAIGAPFKINVLGRYDRPFVSGVVGLGAQDRVRRSALAHIPLALVGGGIIGSESSFNVISLLGMSENIFCRQKNVVCGSR